MALPISRFLAINCGAFNEELLESELFGHEQGAFSGAARQKKGLFEAAEGGTLFLDEVGEMSLAMQVKLLRAVQERTIRRVGGTADIAVDVRLVAATNKNLKTEVEAGRFRQDLYFRLNVLVLNMPPLVQRLEDLPLLARYFVEKACRETERPAPGISSEVLEILGRYAFPGNVRELQNIIERAVVFCTGDEIRPVHLSPELLDAPLHVVRAGDRQPMTLEQCERDQIEWTLQHAADNRTVAAKLLGIDRASLWRKMKRHGL